MANSDDVPPKEQFKVISYDELKEKITELENTNSVYAVKRVEKAFRLFLRESGAPSVEYHLFEEAELDNWLSKFWFGAFTSTDELYTVNSLKSFKYGLKRHLQNIGHAFDITKDAMFKNSQKAFAMACKELKEEGKGFVKNHEEIEDEGNYTYLTQFYLLFQLFSGLFTQNLAI